MITVLLVDDHALIRAAVKSILADISDIQVVGEAENGEIAIQLARKLRPDIVLLDISLPGSSGIEVSKRLLQIDSKIQVLVLSAYEQEVFSSQFLRSGAAGYLTKSASSTELVKAIRAVYNKERYLSSDLALHIANNQLSHIENPFEKLTQREMEILLMVCKGQKIKFIADKLFVSIKTVHGYRYQIFKKLGVKNNVELTRLAIKHGLLES